MWLPSAIVGDKVWRFFSQLHQEILLARKEVSYLPSTIGSAFDLDVVDLHTSIAGNPPSNVDRVVIISNTFLRHTKRSLF